MFKEYTQNKKFIVIEFEIDNLKIKIERLSGSDIWNILIPQTPHNEYNYFLENKFEIKSKKSKYFVIDEILNILKVIIDDYYDKNDEYMYLVKNYAYNKNDYDFSKKRRKYLQNLKTKINSFQKKLPVK